MAKKKDEQTCSFVDYPLKPKGKTKKEQKRCLSLSHHERHTFKVIKFMEESLE
jgi:hypothetical protein